MKTLILSLLLAGAGAGWYGLGDAPPATTEDCASDCRVTVECIGDDTCLVTCWEPDGSIRCQEEVTCDEPCDRPCDRPCDSAAAAPAPTPAKAASACAPGACTRE